MWKKVVRVISVPLGAAFGVGAALLLKEGLTAAKNSGGRLLHCYRYWRIDCDLRPFGVPVQPAFL